MNERDVVRQMFSGLGDVWMRTESPFVAWCESPIERVLAVAFEVGFFFCPRNRKLKTLCSGLPNEHENYINKLEDGYRTTIIASQVEIATYRVDFLVTAKPAACLPPLRLVVECDGHDFHEKTKDQASRDKARDRDIVARGFQIMRFTGSEIWHDPFGCAMSVYNVVENYETRAWKDTAGPDVDITQLPGWAVGKGI